MQDKIFEAPLSENPAGESSDQGLYVVKNHIEELKGEIDMNSWEGEGTRVIIYLPNL